MVKGLVGLCRFANSGNSRFEIISVALLGPMKVTRTRGDEATDCPPNPRVKSCIKCNPNRYDILKITNFYLSNLLKEQRADSIIGNWFWQKVRSPECQSYLLSRFGDLTVSPKTAYSTNKSNEFLTQ